MGQFLDFCSRDDDGGPIITQDIAPISHKDEVDDMVRIGREVERRILAQAGRWHLEDQVLRNGSLTVVFE